MAATFTHLAPPGRVFGAPQGALTCVWRLDAQGRLFGRWALTPITPREPAGLAGAA